MKSVFTLTALFSAGVYSAPAHAGDVHIYTSYASNVPPGFHFPDGPDENVRLVLTCPGSAVSRVAVTLPAGASTSTFGISALEGPIFQDMGLSLTQDYAVSPTRILFRFTLGTIGVAGYLQPADNFDADFNAAECHAPWHLHFSTGPITGAYSPDAGQGLSSAMTPFPAEH